MKYVLTTTGKAEVDAFIREAKAKRKEILNAKLDKASTPLFTESDIISDIAWDGADEYINGWRVTDNYDTDAPLCLIKGIHWEVV